MPKGFIVFSLENKTALVTGGASGIGAAIAETFVHVGATVWIADRDESNGQSVAGRVGAQFLLLNVANDADCLQASEKVGKLDILANVAGIGHVGSLPNTTAADLDRLHAVNVRGVFNCCKAFVPAMLEHKSGSVINMSSVGPG
jgi:2-keto-3-deoxy-L-fuconate dehydrogenase